MAAIDREALGGCAAMRSPAAGRRAQALGISLIEALVAMAVMAFGMLGVVGMQSTLRFNADVSRQRAEAVRIAQQEMETLRAFNGFTAVAGDGIVQFEEIESDGPIDLPVVAEMNTTFSLETEVTASPSGSPPRRNVALTVRWADRRGETQWVQLTSQISYSPPELTALPARRGDRGPFAQPGGRDPSIPREAVPHGDGTSAFTPPGSPEGTRWIFNNNTGLIVQTCLPAGTCTATDSILLSGSVAFGLPTGRFPMPEDAAEPLDPTPAAFSAVGLRAVRVTGAGVATLGPNCLIGPSLAGPTTRLAYYCAIPRPFRGTLQMTGVPLLADDPRPATSTVPGGSEPALTESAPTKFRLCRYTATTGNPNSGITDGATHNSRHPWHYLNATRSYTDRNFLVIRAGNGTTPYPCPDDDPLTPIQSKTYHHPPPPPP